MNIKNIMPALVSGFGAAVITTIPGMNSLGCCLLASIAGGTAVFLHHKLNNIHPPISGKTGSLMGLSTGVFIALFAVLFETMITLIFKSNDFVEALPQMEITIKELGDIPIFDSAIDLYKQMAKEIRTTGFSATYTFSMLFSYIIMYGVFGLIGGLLGMIFVNKRA